MLCVPIRSILFLSFRFAVTRFIEREAQLSASCDEITQCGIYGRSDAGTKLCQELEIKGGVQVVGIKSNGILARARVKEGFVITHINDRPVYSLSDMERMSDKITSIDGIYPNGRAASYMLVE